MMTYFWVDEVRNEKKCCFFLNRQFLCTIPCYFPFFSIFFVLFLLITWNGKFVIRLNCVLGLSRVHLILMRTIVNDITVLKFLVTLQHVRLVSIENDHFRCKLRLSARFNFHIVHISFVQATTTHRIVNNRPKSKCDYSIANLRIELGQHDKADFNVHNIFKQQEWQILTKKNKLTTTSEKKNNKTSTTAKWYNKQMDNNSKKWITFV